MSRLNTKSRIELAHLKRQLELRVQQPWKSSNLRKEPPVFPSAVTKGTLTASGNFLSAPNTNTNITNGAQTATSTNTKTTASAPQPFATSTTTPIPIPTGTANTKNTSASRNNKNSNSNPTATTPSAGGSGENESKTQSLLSGPLPPGPLPGTAGSNNETLRPSKFDYKFVFTNTAMRKEDRIFRVKNPGVAIEKDMKIVKPLMATTSFLPYGVTIRNPHMFEEDQLAVIQRRQQVHNITYPTPQYNPFMTVRRERGSKAKLMSKNNNNRKEGAGAGTGTPSSSSPAPVSVSESVSVSASKLPSRNTGQNVQGFTAQMNSATRTPIIPNRYSSGHAKANRKVRLAHALQNKNTFGKGSAQFNSTALRDSQFRQQFQNLEKPTSDVETNINIKGENFIRNRHKQAVDNLSNTVQHLNRYEERLKHYLKSKNTMSHAGKALKQLCALRSKKISQLSKLAVTLPHDLSTTSNNNTRQLLRSQPAFQNLSALATADQTTTNYNNNKNHNNNNKLRNKGTANQNQGQTVQNEQSESESESAKLPKHPQNYLEDRKFIKSPLDTQRLSRVIGKKNWSSSEKNNRNLGQKWTKYNNNLINNHIGFNINSKNSIIMNAPDFKITPLQAAMMEGVDLDQISDLIGSPKPTGFNPNQSQQKIGPMPVKINTNNSSNIRSTASPVNESNNDDKTNIINNEDNISSFLADKMKPTVSLFRYNDRDRDVRLLRPTTTNKSRFSNLPSFNDASGRDNLSPFNFGSERSSQHNLGYGVATSGIESRRESQIFRRLYNEYHLHEDKIQNELKKEEWSGRRSREKKQSDQSSKRIVELNKQLNYRKVVQL